MQERDEELKKLKKELHQNEKREDILTSHLKQRFKELSKYEAEIGQCKEEVTSLKAQLEETKRNIQEAEDKNLKEELVLLK